MSESTGEPQTRADDDLLAELVDDFLRRHRAGQHASVEEYAREHPALADRIRDLFPAVMSMEHPGAAPFDAVPGVEHVGKTIGRYKLLERIGEGGFGVVYMAEQQHPLRRRVALKVLKPGMDSRQVLARFEAERQALAIMDHPNIARVFDGGMTESGRPYFVLELIKGVPITDFCDRQQLTPRRRLELFAHVCHAVQHAHQKGVIHRDIKPSNVLVIMNDTTPLVKVIDFGVAKALGQELTDKTLFTGFAQLVGTPPYISPEQAGQSALDVDTRSDIYSLGVLLYELLTGSTPFEKERFQKAAHDEICRIIREEEPPKPSTRLSESKESLPSVAAQRHMEPAKLTKLVHGELDWIVMKALEKDRTRRYETAIGMARDIERYLQDEPVEAGPPSAVYRIKKFVHRNKGPVLAGALVLLTLVGGMIGTTIGLVSAEQARRAEAERAEGERQARHEAQAVLDFVEQKVFVAARPEGQDGGLGHDVTLRRAIEAAMQYVDESFADRPLIEARLRQTLGISFSYLGEPKKAKEQFENARMIRTKELGSDHLDTHRSMHGLASSYYALDRHAEALELFEATLAARKVKLGPDHPETLGSMNGLANTYDALGRHAEALTLREQTLALRRVKLGPDHSDTLGSIVNLAISYRQFGRSADAVKLYEEALPVMKAKIPNHSVTFTCMSNLAACYAALGRHADALKLHEEALALRMAKQGPGHPRTLSSMSSLATLYEDVGRHTDALRVISDAIRQYPDNATLYRNRGHQRCQAGDFRGGIADYEQALKLDPSEPWLWYQAAVLYLYTGDVDRYRSACRQLLDLADKLAAEQPEIAEQAAKTCALAPDSVADFSRVERLAQRSLTGTEQHRFRRWFILAKGLTDYRGGRHAEAIEWLQQFAPKVDGKDGDATAFAALAMAHHRLGHTNQARVSLDAAHAIIAQKPQTWRSSANWLHSEILFREAEALMGLKHVYVHVDIGHTLRDQGKLDKAIAAYSTGIEVNPGNAELRSARASAYATMGQWDKAAADYEKQLQLNPTDHWPWYFRACMLAYLGQKQEYAEHCRAMLAQFADTADDGILERTTKSALLLPGSADGDMDQVTRCVERACARFPESRWRMLLKGLAECRAGRYEEAAGLLEKCREVPSGDFFVNGGAIVTAEALLAIARFQLGELDEARAALDRAGDHARKVFPPVDSSDWSTVKVDHWLIAQIALREAAALIPGRQATTAPKP